MPVKDLSTSIMLPGEIATAAKSVVSIVDKAPPSATYIASKYDITPKSPPYT